MSIFSAVWMYTVFSMYQHLRVHVQCNTYEKVSFSYRPPISTCRYDECAQLFCRPRYSRKKHCQYQKPHLSHFWKKYPWLNLLSTTSWIPTISSHWTLDIIAALTTSLQVILILPKGFSHGTISNMIHDDFGLVKKSAWLVNKLLCDGQKNKWV